MKCSPDLELPTKKTSSRDNVLFNFSNCFITLLLLDATSFTSLFRSTCQSGYSIRKRIRRTTGQWSCLRAMLQRWAPRPRHLRNRSLKTKPITQWSSRRPNCLMNVVQAPLRDIIITKIKRQVVDRHIKEIATAVEKTFINYIELGTDSVASQKKPASNELIHVWMSRMIESWRLDSNLKTW